MATNWSAHEVATIVRNVNKDNYEDFKDISKRLPLFTHYATLVNEEGMEILKALPLNCTARKINKALEEAMGIEAPELSEEEKEARKAKRAERKAKKSKEAIEDEEDEEELEEDEDEDGEEEVEEAPKKKSKKSKSSKKSKKLKKATDEDDEDDEDFNFDFE